MASPVLSIIIPAYNEAQRLPGTLEKVKSFCEKHKGAIEVLVVVEKSGDATLAMARQAASGQPLWKVIGNEVQRGKGYAVRCGMLEAKGEVLFFMDADLSVPLCEILTFTTFLREHPEVDLIFGSRKHPESRITRRQSPLRNQMGETFNFIVRRLAGIELRDTQCGFKAFRQEAARAIFSRQQLDGFAFDVEVYLLAKRLGLNIAELPLEWENAPDSRVNILSDSIRMLYDVLRVRRLLR